MYGLKLTKEKKDKIKNVVSLKAKIIQVRNVAQGDTIGYGASYVVKQDSKIAILGIGYADGLPRNYKGKVYIKGYKASIVGRISMDLCNIDITDIPNIKANQWVELFGDNISIYDFAKTCNTISYEIASRLGNRIYRIYIK